MKRYDYPFVPKEIYPAVMFAEKMIKEGESFGMAAYKSANYYCVDFDELKHQLAIRQGVRRRGRPSVNKGKTYKYYVVAYVSFVEATGSFDCISVSVDKGLSRETVENKYDEADFRRTRHHDTGSAWSPSFFHRVVGEYDTKEEAEQASKGVNNESLHY